AGHNGDRLRQRSRRDQSSVRALLRDDAAVGGDGSQSALRGPNATERLPGLHRVRRHRFARIYFSSKTTLDQIYSALSPMVERFNAMSSEERGEFRRQLPQFVRLYAFLSQVLTFADVDLEKLYQFARYLRRLLPADRAELPLEVQQNIDMESYRI